MDDQHTTPGTADAPVTRSTWPVLEAMLAGERAGERSEESEAIATAIRAGMRLSNDPASSPEDVYEGIAARVAAVVPHEIRPLTRTRRLGVAISSARRWMAAALVAGSVGAAGVAIGVGHKTPISATHVYATRPGQRATVRMSDGTGALLGPATTLSVVRRNGMVQADVSGDVQFTVTAQSAASFTVRAGRATARVLGTTFSVRRYSNESVTRIVVRAGRVQVRGHAGGPAASQTAVLTGDMTGMVDDSGHVQVSQEIVAADYTDWATGRLVFRATPMSEIVTELSRAYGADIRMADSTLRQRVITLTIPTERRPLDDVLSLLAMSVGAHVTRFGDVRSIVPGTTHEPHRSPTHPKFSPETQYGR